MKKWIRKHSLILLAALSLPGIMGTWAYFSDQVAVVNELQIGDVNISLREYELEQGKEIPYRNQKIIQPGDIISKIPRITNEAEPCWLRVRVQYQNSEKELEGFSSTNLKGISSKWVQKGDYYYYTDILKNQTSVDLFHEVKVPDEWDETHSEQMLTIEVQAEAIQAANYQPDFDAMSPWGNEEIELCIHETDDRMIVKKEKVLHKVEFNGTAHKLLAISNDFFSNFETAMPGDLLIDYAELSNTTSKAASLYFHAEPIGAANGEQDLLEKLQLEIHMDGKVLYSGNLYADPLKEERMIANLKPGAKGRMKFAVKVPETLKNGDALKHTSVKWIFRVEEDEKISPTPQPERAEYTDTGSVWNYDTTEAGGSSDRSESVKTGDATPIAFYLGLLAAGILLLMAGIMMIRERSKRE